MKKLYFGFLLLLTISAFGQDRVNTENTSPSQKGTFKLYPNPVTNGVVYITTKVNSHKEIMIYDVFGELVLTDRITQNRLDISKLLAGVYMLQVTEMNQTMTRKLVVK